MKGTLAGERRIIHHPQGRRLDMIKYVRTVRGTVVRKGIANIGCKLGEFAIASRGSSLSYALEIQLPDTSEIQTVYLDFHRSKDFYRIPVGQPLFLNIGTDGKRVGRWLDTWSLDDTGLD
jgi:hypothetical protein